MLNLKNRKIRQKVIRLRRRGHIYYHVYDIIIYTSEYFGLEEIALTDGAFRLLLRYVLIQTRLVEVMLTYIKHRELLATLKIKHGLL